MTANKRILILFVPSERTPYFENISMPQVRRMKTALQNGGWHAADAEYDPDFIHELFQEHKPDRVFNLVYGFRTATGQILELQPDSVSRMERYKMKLVGSTS